MCPNFNDPKWVKLVEIAGSNNKAYEIYLENDHDYPQNIYNQVSENLEADTTADALDPKLVEKQDLLNKMISVLEAKLSKQARQVNNDPTKKEILKNFGKTVKEMNRLQTDQAIMEFVKSADRMTNYASNMIKDMRINPEEVTIKDVQRLEEYTKPFDLLDELNVEKGENSPFKGSEYIIDRVKSKREEIHKGYKQVAKRVFANEMLPFYYDKVKAYYEVKAEREYSKQPAKNLRGEAAAKDKEKFVESYLTDQAVYIQMDARDLSMNALSSIEDIAALTSLVSNKRDIPNDVFQFAIDKVDKADLEIHQAFTKKVKESKQIYDNFINHYGKKSDQKEQYAPFINLPEEGSEQGPELVETLDSKWVGTPVEDMFNFLREIQEFSNDNVFGTHKLGNKIASLNKDIIERLTEGNVFSAIRESAKDITKLRAGDEGLGDINERIENGDKINTVDAIVDEAGKERNVIPIHYRGKVEEKDRSYDILSIALLEFKNAKNFSVKKDLNVDIQAIIDIVQEGQVKQRESISRVLKVGKGTTNAVTKSGKESNIYKNLVDLQRHRIYGIEIEGDPKMIKKVKALKKASSLINLSFNALSAGGNYIQGNAMTLIEAAGGKAGNFGMKERMWAAKQIRKDMGNMIKDSTLTTPKHSKTNLLAEHFDTEVAPSALNHKYSRDNLLKKTFGTGSLMFMNRIAENNPAQIAMRASLKNIKVKDKDGDYININGEKVSKDKAMSIDEAYSVEEGGKLKLDDRVAATELTEGVSEADMKKISSRLQAVHRHILHDGDLNNSSRLKRTIVGTLLMHMHGWLEPLIRFHWQGFGTLYKNKGTKKEDLDLEQLNWDPSTGKFREGIYTTALWYLKDVVKDFKALKLMAVKDNWDKLTTYEKGNLRKLLVETGFILTALTVYALAAAAYEEDDDEAMLYVAYFSRRAFSELSMYSPTPTGFGESLNILQRPVVSQGVVESALKVVSTIIPPYKEDDGEKLKKRLMKLVPRVKGFDADHVQSALYFLTKR